MALSDAEKNLIGTFNITWLLSTFLSDFNIDFNDINKIVWV